ncbi:hypothetical protein TSUD_418990 [Trifolium subterraneum]|uniref:Uncharacterized protein n=1 Tax=Trifolium subterraneum TaxID=3900 RepID=A0A1B5Z8A9_TRISU|nr:hypothetical protein TSUD_418990 [Trifolium subterraneum]
MKNTQLTLRKLAAEKKKRALGASSSTPNISEQTSPSPSIKVTGERRVEEVTGDRRPPKVARTEAGGSGVVGGHRLVPGRPAEEFVIPPAMGHDCMLDGKTRMKISEADQTILASMGPESIRNVVAESSVAVFKLLEVATFLNDLSSETKALKESQAKVAQLEKDLLDAKEEEKALKGRVGELEEKLSSMTLTPTADEEEKKVDPAGTYANFTRAGLISKIYEVGDLQLEVDSSSFRNALSQLQILNPGVQLITEGLDEMKEVRDGQIASPLSTKKKFNLVFNL